MNESKKQHKDYSDSRFKTHIRIDPKQKKWIIENKGKYTQAGKLDQIINFYRKKFKQWK